jgi:hypothetical protein
MPSLWLGRRFPISGVWSEYLDRFRAIPLRRHGVHQMRFAIRLRVRRSGEGPRPKPPDEDDIDLGRVQLAGPGRQPGDRAGDDQAAADRGDEPEAPEPVPGETRPVGECTLLRISGPITGY